MTREWIAARWRLLAAILLAAVTWQIRSLAASSGLDPSWQVGLHLAWSDDIHYGAHFAWTYGPLGFLAFPLAVGSGTLFLAFCFVAAGQIALAYLLVRRLAPRFTVAGALVLGYVVLGVPSEPAGFLLLIELVLVAWALDDPEGIVAYWFPYAGGGLAAITALTRADLGIAAVAIAVAAAVALAVEGDRRAAATPGVVLVGFLVGWLVSGESLGDLGGWLRLSASLVAGYSAAQQYEQPGLHGEYVLALVAALLLLALAGWRAAGLGRVRGSALVLAVVLFGFVFFKQGFVHHDAPHSAAFFAAIAIAALALARRDLTRVLALACVVLCVWTTHRSHALDYAPLTSARDAVSQLADVVVPPRRDDLIAGSRAAEQRSYDVPARLLRKLNGYTVHVDPFETAAVSAYQLAWRPLPVMQAGSVYTSRLDLANAAFLRSTAAPDRILRENTATTVDGRGRELEAPAELRALICSNAQIGVSARWQVLTHVKPRCFNNYRFKTVKARSGLPVPVPQAPRSNQMVVAHISTGHSKLNGLRGFFWKPALPSISLGGGPFTPLLAATAHDGIVVHVPDVAGFDPQFGGAIDWTTIAVRGAYGPIRIDFDAVPMHGKAPYPVGERSETPLPGYRLLTGSEVDRVVSPRGTVLRVVPGGGVLDYAFVQRTSLVLRGWSADAVAGVPASTILVFADGKLVFAGTPNRRRPDVASGLGHPQLLRSGYRLLVPLRDVLAGRRRRQVRVFSVANGKALEVSYSQSYAWR